MTRPSLMRSPLKYLSILLLLGSFCLMAQGQQQSSTTRYVYDVNGRLRAVIAPNGEAGVYEYDPAGNITNIRRLAADALELLSFSPQVGSPLERVTLYGVGIGNGLTAVSFNGVAARVISSSPIGIVVEVPIGATSGPITIVTTRGSVSTAAFTVRGIGITPPSATIDATERLQFQAFVANASGDQSVQWRVNGIVGGDNTVGMMTSGGLYTAPFLPNDVERRDYIIRATSVSDPDLVREVTITVRGLNGILGLAASSVSVYLPPSGALTTSMLQPTATSVSVYLTPSGTLTTSTLQPTASGVSVYFTPSGSLTTSMLQPTASGVSVYFTPSGTLTISTLQPTAAAVSVTTGPIIASVVPATLTRGANVSVTVTGANLSGVTQLFILQSNNTADPNLTVTNLTVNPSGTSLTATITATANAVNGQRWFVVATDNVASPAFTALQIVAP